MSIKSDIALQINTWLIKARWIYATMIAVAGFLVKFFGQYDYSYLFVLSSVSSIYLVNLLLYLGIKEVKNLKEFKYWYLISCCQVILELVVFTLVFYMLGGLEGITFIFFFLTIIASAVLFGSRGATVISVVSGTLVSLVVMCEYFGIIAHRSYYGSTVNLYDNPTVLMVQTIMVCFFYIVVGVYSSFLAVLLRKEAQYRENELNQLDMTSKLMTKRDKELIRANNELDEKLTELKLSEKSMMKAFSDLSKERKKSETEKKKIDAIISNFVDPIIVLDKESKISLINPVAMQIFGFIGNDLGKKVSVENNYSMNNFRGITKTDFEVKGFNELKIEDRNIEEIVVEGEEKGHVFKVTTVQVHDDDGSDIGTMKIFYDLTREKMLDRLKSEFISIAAHQLRTPLSAIKWVIRMVLDGDAGRLNEEQSEILEKGYRSNERVIELVDDMLNVSRIEEGRFGYSFEKENFIEVLNIVIDSLSRRIEDKKLNLILDVPEKMKEVKIDKKKMILVLQNLIENAVKYTPDRGEIKISVKMSGDFLKVKVKDNGVGIPEEDQKKLFSKFFRARNVIRLQTEGSGLGLFIVKNIIKKHGGHISFVSNEGEGAEFVFTLLLKK